MQPAEKLHARNYCANRTTKSANPGRYVPLTPLTPSQREASESHRRRLIIDFETFVRTQLRNAAYRAEGSVEMHSLRIKGEKRKNEGERTLAQKTVFHFETSS